MGICGRTPFQKRVSRDLGYSVSTLLLYLLCVPFLCIVFFRYLAGYLGTIVANCALFFAKSEFWNDRLLFKDRQMAQSIAAFDLKM